MSKRYNDWIKQAEKDLQHAIHSLDCEDYEWACFASQQSAEKALKGLYDFLGGESWGHSILKLLKELPEKVDEDLLQKAAYLDKIYIPACYPNSFDSGTLSDYFTKKDAEESIKNAEDILSFVKAKVYK